MKVQAGAENQPTLIVRCGAIFDVSAGEMRRDVDIVVRGDTITAVRPAGSPEGQGRSDLLLDLSDRYVLPGLINTHVHLSFDSESDPRGRYLAESPTVHVARAVQNARTLLMSGVTTARDCGSGWELLPLAEAGRARVFPAPRLLLCGPPITPTAGHLHFMDGEADTPDEIRKGVRRRYKEGAGSIKIMATGGQMTPGSIPERASYDLQQLEAAVSEAKKLNLSTVAHCLSPDGIELAARAGTDSLEHCAFFVREEHGWLERRFDESVMHQVRDAGSFVMMGLSASYHSLDEARAGKPQSPHEAFRLTQEGRMFEIFRRFAEAGIPMVCGTDAGVRRTPFDETYLELVLMAQGGLSPVEALRSASSRAAEALGLGDEVGRIAPGYRADLIAMDADPLADLRALSRVDWVMSDGQVVRDDGRRKPARGASVSG